MVDSTLFEIGGIWNCLVRVLPSATELVLNLNCCSEILKPMGELMWRAWKDQSFTLRLVAGGVPRARNTAFLAVTKEDIEIALDWGVLQTLMYDLKQAPQLKTITVEATMLAGAWHIISEYEDNRMNWRFNKDGNPDTNEAKYLVWGREAIAN